MYFGFSRSGYLLVKDDPTITSTIYRTIAFRLPHSSGIENYTRFSFINA